MSTVGQRGGSHFDVLIVGFGPVGAALAGLLGRAGLEVLVLERERDVYPLPRAGHIDHSVLRTLEELGCLDRALPEMVTNRGTELLGADGEILAYLPVQNRTPSGLPASLHFHQPSLDRAMRDAVAQVSSVTTIYSAEVVGLTQTDDRVKVDYVTASGRAQASAAYVVGCDGANSKVRREAGIGLNELNFAESWVVIDLILRNHPESLPRNTTFGADPKRPYAAIELPGMRYRFEFMVLPDDDTQSLTSEERVTELVGPWLDAPDIYKVERALIYTFRSAIAEGWRQGRALLAGDAAHLMPPFLGQGMCSGIRDAANLAWKLTRVVKGLSQPDILDTYEGERSPHVLDVINTATLYGRVLCELDPRAAEDRDAKVRATSPDPAGRMGFKLGELPPSPLVQAGGGRFMINTGVGGESLDELTAGRFYVVARNGAASGPSAQWWREQADAIILEISELPPSAAQDLAEWLDLRGGDVAVVRPDRVTVAVARSLAEIARPPLLERVDAG